jgi:hypothetical protein
VLLAKKGLALIAAVMLTVFIAVAVLSISTFIIRRLSQVVTDNINTDALYLAQAGINDAIYWFRFRDIAANGYFTLGAVAVASGKSFTLTASAADLLMVNTATAALASSNRNLTNLTIQNATNSNTIVIDRMVVTWNNSRVLQDIIINGSTVWSGSSGSPANVNITNFTLNTTPTIYPITRLRFNNSMTGATITIQFVMTDGSTRTVTVFPASNNNIFTVTSTGNVTGSSIYRRVKADYNLKPSPSTPRIDNYSEIP